MNKRSTGFIAVVVFSVAACLGAYHLDWNLLRPYIARHVTEATGRSFAIHGDLHVQFSSPPKIIANGIEMGNVAWGRQPIFAQAKRVELTLDWRQLLHSRLHFHSMALSAPLVHLEVNDQGQPNWVLPSGHRGDQHHFLDVDTLSIDHGTLTYVDPVHHNDFAVAMDTEETPQAVDASVRVTGSGRIKGLPASVTGRIGALLRLRTADVPYPIDIHAAVGATQLTLAGTLSDPFRLEGSNVAFTLAGHDLAQLYPLFGIPIAPTPPYKIAGTLSHTGARWSSAHLQGLVGKATYEQSPCRPGPVAQIYSG